MPQSRHAIAASILGTTAILLTPATAECVRYSLKVANSAGTVTPNDLNHLDDLVGTLPAAEGDRAWVAWNAGTAVLLNLPGQTDSKAYGINSGRKIVGTLTIGSSPFEGFMYFNGRVTYLGYLPSHTNSEAKSINDNDRIVGFSANTQIGPILACRWNNGQIETAPTSAGQDAKANDINSDGAIVGWMGVAPTTHFYAEAFLWDGVRVANLGKPANATNSCAIGISDNGLICGYYSLADPQGAGGYKRRALAWINGEMVDLGVLPGYLQSQAFGVDDSGYVVGYCNNPPALGNGVRGFIWRDGVMVPLISLLDVNQSLYEVWYPSALTNQRKIAAAVRVLGTGQRAALLTPILPKPGDTNCDWLVNVTDLLAVINHWGPAPPDIPFEGSPDLNGDGQVNVTDLLAVINNWSLN